MSSVFLSHSHDDKKFARRLTRDLRREGHIVWIDEAQIQIGDSLIEKIRDGIDRVDYLIAVLSEASVNSRWVQRELDIAMNRELEEEEVVVLPVMLEEVEPPGFLKGKLWADFREPANYESEFLKILDRLGPGQPLPDMPAERREELAAKVAEMEEALRVYRDIDERKRSLVAEDRSEALREAIQRESRRNPEFALINEAYGFEVMGTPITIGYALHSIRKAMTKGGHPLDVALSLEGKWPDLREMLIAYRDYMGIEGTAGNDN